MATRKVFVGIDVSKDWLDVAVPPWGDCWRSGYDDSGIAALVRKLSDLKPAIVCWRPAADTKSRSLLPLPQPAFLPQQ